MNTSERKALSVAALFLLLAAVTAFAGYNAGVSLEAERRTGSQHQDQIAQIYVSMQDNTERCIDLVQHIPGHDNQAGLSSEQEQIMSIAFSGEYITSDGELIEGNPYPRGGYRQTRLFSLAVQEAFPGIDSQSEFSIRYLLATCKADHEVLRQQLATELDDFNEFLDSQSLGWLPMSVDYPSDDFVITRAAVDYSADDALELLNELARDTTLPEDG